MDSNLTDSILTVWRALNKFLVKYMIGRDTAVALYGYKSSFAKKEIITQDGTEIPFINYEDLILDKQVNARSKDITDLEQPETNKQKKKE